MKSDILQYEILNKEGGVYISIDYECLQSIWFARLSKNGIIGSISGH